MEANLIGNLKEIRAILREDISAASRLCRKFVGPQPKDEGQQKVAQETVGSIVQELLSMSAYLGKILQDHHSFVGEFTPDSAESAPAPRFA